MNEERDNTAQDDGFSPVDGAVETDGASPGDEWGTTETSSSASAGEDMRGLVTFIVSNLLDDTSEVEIEAEQRNSSVHLRLRVPADDLGKVIGRQGRVARAMRTALTIAGSRHNVRASLDIEG